MASAPPIAFDIVLLCTAGIVVLYTLFLADSVGRVLSGREGRGLSVIGIVLFVAMSVAFLRPSWFARLGGRDHTAPVRFLLTWLRKEWANLYNTTRQGPALLRVAERELSEIREPANAALVDEWVVLMQTYLRKSRLGSVSDARAQRQFEERLKEVRPVDRIARVF